MDAPQFLKRLLGLKDARRAANLVARGVVRAREQDVSGALEFYRQALAADDGYALAHLNVALALQDLYNEERATLDPDAHQQRLSEMADHLRQAVELDARLIPGFRALGFVERALGHFAASQEAFEHYLEHTDAKDPHRERVNIALQEVTARAAIEEDIRIGVTVAERVAQSEEPVRTDAEARLRRAVEKEPGRAEAYWALGVLRRAARDVTAAREFLEKALSVDGECTVAHKELASLHFREDAPDRALPHARAVYEADPTNPEAVCNLGVCHLALGELKEAREFIQIAKGLAPKDPIVQEALRAVEESSRGTSRR